MRGPTATVWGIPVGLHRRFSSLLIFCVHGVLMFILPARVIKCQKKGFCKSFNTDKKQRVIYRDEESLPCPFPSWIVRYTKATSSAPVQYLSQYFTTCIFTFRVGKPFSVTSVKEKNKFGKCLLRDSLLLRGTSTTCCSPAAPSTLGTENHGPRYHCWGKMAMKKTDLPKNSCEDDQLGGRFHLSWSQSSLS